MNKKRFWLFHLIVFLSILHLWEEWVTNISFVDPVAKFLGSILKATPLVVFYVAELLLFVYIAVLLLIQLQKKRIAEVLLFLLSLASIFEFEHVFEAIKVGGYYPGLWSGVALGIAGLFLLVDLLRRK